MHDLSPLSLGLDTATCVGWTCIKVLVLFLFLETYVLQRSFLGKVVLLPVHTSAEGVEGTHWSTSTKRVEARSATRVNSSCSLKGLGSLIVLIEAIVLYELILTLGCDCISPCGRCSLIHWSIDSNERVGTSLQIISLSRVKSHPASSPKVRLGSTLSVIFVMSK